MEITSDLQAKLGCREVQKSPRQLSQVSLTPATAYLVTKGCLSDWCGFLCEHTFSSVLGFLLRQTLCSPTSHCPLLHFSLIWSTLVFEVLVMRYHACLCPQRVNVTQRGGGLLASFAFFGLSALWEGDGDSTLAHT